MMFPIRSIVASSNGVLFRKEQNSFHNGSDLLEMVGGNDNRFSCCFEFLEQGDKKLLVFGGEAVKAHQIATISAGPTPPWMFSNSSVVKSCKLFIAFLLSDFPICNDEDPHNKNPRK